MRSMHFSIQAVLPRHSLSIFLERHEDFKANFHSILSFFKSFPLFFLLTSEFHINVGHLFIVIVHPFLFLNLNIFSANRNSHYSFNPTNP